MAQRKDPTAWRTHALALRNPARVLIHAAASRSAVEIAFKHGGTVPTEMVAGLIELFSDELVAAVNAVHRADGDADGSDYSAILQAMDDDDA